MRLKILLVITGLNMGGAEVLVVNLADKLVAIGHEVTLAYIIQPAIVTPKNSKVSTIWLGGRKSIYGFLCALRKLVGLIRQIQPNVVHSHMYHANILARFARLFTGKIFVISSAHNSNEVGLLRMIVYRLTNRHADLFTNVCDDAVRAYEDKGAVVKGGMISVMNGIDINRFRFIENGRASIRKELAIENKIVFISIGRLHVAKDYPNLIAAFSIVVQQHPNVHLLIVGDGELRRSIEFQIKELSLLGKVSLLGIRNDIPQLLSASDVYVISSAWEGSPLALAEAMATERVVVSTDCGGSSELIGDLGFIVPRHDSQALAHGMLNAVSLSETEARALGFKARKRIVETFSLDRVVDAWVALYGSFYS